MHWSVESYFTDFERKQPRSVAVYMVIGSEMRLILFVTEATDYLKNRRDVTCLIAWIRLEVIKLAMVFSELGSAVIVCKIN